MILIKNESSIAFLVYRIILHKNENISYSEERFITMRNIIGQVIMLFKELLTLIFSAIMNSNCFAFLNVKAFDHGGIVKMVWLLVKNVSFSFLFLDLCLSVLLLIFTLLIS